MESLWKVWFSRRRKVYVRIARQYGSTPWQGVLFRTWRQVQVAQRHADIGSVTAAGSYFAYLPLVIID